MSSNEGGQELYLFLWDEDKVEGYGKERRPVRP